MGFPGSVKANPRSENRELVELGGTGGVAFRVQGSEFRCSGYRVSGFVLRVSRVLNVLAFFGCIVFLVKVSGSKAPSLEFEDESLKLIM